MQTLIALAKWEPTDLQSVMCVGGFGLLFFIGMVMLTDWGME